jgi:hypothetical protein
MRIDELRSTLHEHGDAVEAASPTTRLAEVHGRIRTARRRRTAVVAGGAAVAVAAVALTVVPNLQQDPAPAPAGPPQAAGYTKDGVTFRDEVLGERLLGARIGDPGENEVSFDLVVGEEGLRFSPVCYGVGDGYMVDYAIADSPIGGVGCSRERPRDPDADGTTIEAAPAELLDDWGLRPGDTTQLTLSLVRVDDEGGAEPATHPDAVIGGAVYEDTRPTQTVAGVEVPEVLEHGGRVWEVASIYESGAGSRGIDIWSDEDDGTAEDQLTVFAVSGLRGNAAYDVLVDDEVVDSRELQLGQGSPTWHVVQEVGRGTVYELAARVTRGRTDRTRLAFVHYWPAG